VLAVALAALLSRVVPMPGALLVLLLAVCCGAVSLGAALIAEISVRVGAGGGAFAAALVAPVLGLTIAAAPLAPGRSARASPTSSGSRSSASWPR